MKFWPMNWGWEKSAQKWFQKTFRKTRRTSGRKGALFFWIKLKMTPIFRNMSLLVTRLGCLRCSETKRQSMEWHTSTSPRPKKARMAKSKIKCMLICFFDIHGIVHKEFVPQGRQTVNQYFYREVLERLRKRVIHVRPNIKNKWVLHHDNARCHTAISINNEVEQPSGLPTDKSQINVNAK